MIKSMTGYGGAKGEVENFPVSVELKSVNNRFLDVSVRLPRSYIFAEEPMKAAVGKRLNRGKVDVFVTVDAAQVDDVQITVNSALAAGYVRALEQISAENGLSGEISPVDIARFPEVLSVEKVEADRERFAAGLTQVLESALDELEAMRCREGARLEAYIRSRLERIEALVGIVEARSPETVAAYRARLEQRLQEVLADRALDEQRILTEAAIFADRVAVDEETVRLRSHIAQMREMLAAGSPVGRKLDFLIQEFNREANTIGSKCSDAELAKVVVELKGEIEKIREQVQNIE